MAILYIPVYKFGEEIIEVDASCFILHYILKCISACNFNIVYAHDNESKRYRGCFPVNRKVLTWKYSFSEKGKLPITIINCHLPCLEACDNVLVSGLCAVLRSIIKLSLTDKLDEDFRRILGFREGCLSQCAEVSLWTKFCECDVLNILEHVWEDVLNSSYNEIGNFVEVGILEGHLQQPVRMHNIGKYKHRMGSNELIEVRHIYVDGPEMLLSDLILFPTFHVLFHWLSNYRVIFKDNYPCLTTWYDTMCPKWHFDDFFDESFKLLKPAPAGLLVNLSDIRKSSLYKRDPHRYKPRWKIFTKQDDVTNSIALLMSNGIKPLDAKEIQPTSLVMSDIFSIIPVTGNHLPNSRYERKCQQIYSIANAVTKVAKPGDVIVDFCSGSGHVGITIASLLPHCHIILVENKEESLRRAQDRVDELHLENILLIQSNLDYFVGQFDVGVCLHGCGVATDLVLQKCLDLNACFVLSPCCYGGMHNTHTITYPRSEKFLALELPDNYYFVLCHSADQTKTSKDIQGKLCMSLIDTDRLMLAKDNGYSISLYHMSPPECTPKNHILVGCFNDIKFE